MDLHHTLAENVAAIQTRIERACLRAQRDPQEVTLIAVSKTVPAATVRAAYEIGLRNFGESYGQELRDKAADLADLTDLRWHFIGPLQKNKIKYVVGRCTLIHSVDSLELMDEIEKRAAQLTINQEVLIQLNLSREETKSGIGETDLEKILNGLAQYPHCRGVGLMTMPPFFDDPQQAAPFFARLHELKNSQVAIKREGVDLRHLSMGMSGDFEVAIEQGATLIRVGTAIFGGR